MEQFELVLKMKREQVIDITMRQPNVLFNDWEKTTLPKILFLKQFYSAVDIKKAVIDEPVILKRSWYRLSRIKFINDRPGMIFGGVFDHKKISCKNGSWNIWDTEFSRIHVQSDYWSHRIMFCTDCSWKCINEGGYSINVHQTKKMALSIPRSE